LGRVRRVFSRQRDEVVIAGVRSPEAFRDLLDYERACSDRHGHAFSLLAFRIGNPVADTRRVRGLVAVLKARLRGTDVVGWIDGENLGVLLPFTDSRNASQLVREIEARLSARIPLPPCTVYPYPADSSPGDGGRGGDGGVGVVPAGGTDPAAGPGHEASSRGGEESRRDRGALAREELLPCGRAPSLLGVQPLPVWKRLVDIGVVSVGLIGLSPVLLLTALMVKLTSRGPILFCQERTGQNLRRFKMYKFRTMAVDAHHLVEELSHLNEMDGPVFKCDDDPRLTRIGKLLRKTSLDELPQLLNVLTGDMTLIGPRALSPLPSRYERWQLRRFCLVPGIACSWQATRRAETSFVEWMRSDLRYIDSGVSPTKDCRLLLRTLVSVLGCLGGR